MFGPFDGGSYDSFTHACKRSSEPWAKAWLKVVKAQKKFEDSVLDEVAEWVRQNLPGVTEVELYFEFGDHDDPGCYYMDFPEGTPYEVKDEFNELFGSALSAFVLHRDSDTIRLTL